MTKVQDAYISSKTSNTNIIPWGFVKDESRYKDGKTHFDFGAKIFTGVSANEESTKTYHFQAKSGSTKATLIATHALGKWQKQHPKESLSSLPQLKAVFSEPAKDGSYTVSFYRKNATRTSYEDHPDIAIEITKKENEQLDEMEDALENQDSLEEVTTAKNATIMLQKTGGVRATVRFTKTKEEEEEEDSLTDAILEHRLF